MSPDPLAVDPGAALIIFAALALALAVLFWPRRGLASRIGQLLRITGRVRIEDALKHLDNGEFSGRACSVESLAGALEVSRGRAVRLLARLEALGLARSSGTGIPLTDEGRAYALRILRTHRLWERFLADRTGVAPTDWHDRAERAEHRLTPDTTERLAAGMGHPLYDPHGDPIPTATGELRARGGVPLTALRAGDAAVIVHLEDEPREVYDRLVAEGLSPRMEVKVLEAAPSGIRFQTENREHVLEPVLASHVSVARRPRAPEVEDAHETLASLAPGESARVVHIASTCHGPQRRRLLDLGLVAGTVVSAELVSAAGDPVAYRIRGALVALRRAQAESIHVVRGAPARGD
jgi:DtxR family Mn-dependent transcriptional regulator